jgi:uncharacterized protein (UPF0548 family)
MCRSRLSSAGDGAASRTRPRRGCAGACCAGLKVEATTEVGAVGSEVIVHLGPVRAPCRVVYVVDEPGRRGFAYGTLRGHAESGEELFLVRYDPATDEVYADSPVTSAIQRLVTDRYLRAL